MNEEHLYIEDELKDAPTLKAMKGKGPFQVPHTYFEEFPESLSIALGQPEDPALSLALTPKANDEVFTVPDGYFDSFVEKIAIHIDQEKQPGKVLPFWRNPKFAVSIAAAVLMLIIGIWVLFPKKPLEVQFSDEELLAAIEAEGIETFELLEALDHSDLAAAFEMDLLGDEEADLDKWMDELDVYDLENELKEGI